MENRKKILGWSIIVALGGLLFGFDVAVISGAERYIQTQFELSEALLGQTVAMGLYGTVIGALLAGWLADRLGRRLSLIYIAALYLISAIGSAIAPEVYSLMLFRFLGGLGVGASSVVAPMYISEVAPADIRGRLTAMFQFNLVTGILIAYFTNYLIGIWIVDGWRWMLGAEVVPAILFFVFIFKVPESPRWLITKREDLKGALSVLKKIYDEKADQVLAEIQSTNTIKEDVTLGHFFTRQFRSPIIWAFLIAFFNQVSGINAVIYYAPRIFAMTGMEDSASLLSSVGIGIVNLIFTMAGLALIDKMGRRFLMYIGSIGYIISLSAVAWAFFTESFSGWLVPAWLFVFIASHAIGQGAVIWVFIAEVFPNEVRGFGQSLGSGTHWVMAALIAGLFPLLATSLGAGPIFSLFAVMMVLQLLFVHFMMPETKGLSLEALEKLLLKRKV
jgi:SP family arabinose:H+ symporter-like MFS transporter